MLSRRSLLRGATSLAAAAPLSLALRPDAAASAASGPAAVPSGADAVPETLSAARGAVDAGVTLAPEFPLTHLSVSAGADVRLRTADGWQPWRAASGCPAGPDAAAAAPATALIPAAGAVAYQVRTSDGRPAAVTELNTVDGPARGGAAPATALPLPRSARSDWRPRYLSRAAWGADESYRYNRDGTLDTPPAFYAVQALTVHHSGEDVAQPDPIAHIRGIYYNQAVTQDWGDIGYQLLIDAAGRVYEGVYSDEDHIPVFGPSAGPAGLPMMVNGAHVGGFNAGNVGVCLLGNFMQAPPSTAAVRSLTVVLALLASATRLDPEGTTDYVNPVSGATATLRTISGHQDWHRANPNAGPTLCPGDHLYAQLPRIRRTVAALTRLLG
jgi:hypothetical protein